MQLDLVNKFRSKLKDRNVLYWEYEKIEQFQQFLRLHITQRLDDLRKPFVIKANIPNQVNEILDEEELGVLDYQEIIEDDLLYATQSIIRISDATSWVGQEISKKTDEHDRMNKRTNGIEISNKIMREFYGRLADKLNEFSNRVDPEVVLFSKHFEKAITAISKQGILFQFNTNGTWDLQIIETATALTKLTSDIKSGISGMKIFLEAAGRFPRMEKELNKARRLLETTLTKVVNTLEVNLQLTMELEKEFISLLKNEI